MKIILKAAVTAALMVPGIAFAQSEKEIEAPTAAASTSSTTWLPNTLFKLSTGLYRESGYNSYSGLLVPIVPGVEHQLTPKFSVYGNLFPQFLVGGRRYSWDRNTPFVQLNGINVDLGARYYYNQAKRKQRGRAHGPFVGNYLALQLNNDWYSYKSSDLADARRQYGYDCSGITALWGMQRRLGRWGLFDGGAGIGINNDNYVYVFDYKKGRGYAKRRAEIVIEINARIGLAH